MGGKKMEKKFIVGNSEIVVNENVVLITSPKITIESGR